MGILTSKETKMALRNRNYDTFGSFQNYSSLLKKLTEETIMNLGSGNQEMGSWPITGVVGPTRRNLCYTMKGSPRGQRLHPVLISYNPSLMTNVGLISTISQLHIGVSDWPTTRVHQHIPTVSKQHTNTSSDTHNVGLATPLLCAWIEILDPALKPGNEKLPPLWAQRKTS
jgi:hypothetical protein